MAEKRTRTVYRDTQTGKFVKRSTWKRSKAHGGRRYKRERIKERPGGGAPPTPGTEYVIAETYRGKKRNRGEIRIHVIGPAGLTKDEVLDRVEQWSLRMDSGIEVRGINWRNKEYPPDKLRTMVAKMLESGKLS